MLTSLQVCLKYMTSKERLLVKLERDARLNLQVLSDCTTY